MIHHPLTTLSVWVRVGGDETGVRYRFEPMSMADSHPLIQLSRLWWLHFAQLDHRVNPSSTGPDGHLGRNDTVVTRVSGLLFKVQYSHHHQLSQCHGSSWEMVWMPKHYPPQPTNVDIFRAYLRTRQSVSGNLLV